MYRLLYLLSLLHQPKSRAVELLRLRRHLHNLPARALLSPDEVRLAARLRSLRALIPARIGAVGACASCAKDYPPPHGQWEGGHCCGGTTSHVFTNDELDCLHAGGLHPLQLRSSSHVHAGCAFRGPSGCVLPPENRPNICARYLCRRLIAELRQRETLTEIEQLCTELERVFLDYKTERDARIERQTLLDAERAIASTRGKRLTRNSSAK